MLFCILLIVFISIFDIKIYLLFRNLDCNFWRYLDFIFDEKILLLFITFLIFYLFANIIIKSKKDYLNLIKTKNIKKIFLNIIEQLKNTSIFTIFLSFFISFILTFIMKFIIGRARPVLMEGIGFTGFEPFSSSWVFNSMPSGHVALSSSIFIALSFLYPKYKVLFYILIILIAVSRVSIGDHFPTDVLMGLIIGFLSYYLGKRIIRFLNG